MNKKVLILFLLLITIIACIALIFIVRKHHKESGLISSGDIKTNYSGEIIENEEGTFPETIAFSINDLNEYQRAHIAHGGGALSRRYIFKLL